MCLKCANQRAQSYPQPLPYPVMGQQQHHHQQQQQQQSIPPPSYHAQTPPSYHSPSSTAPPSTTSSYYAPPMNAAPPSYTANVTAASSQTPIVLCKKNHECSFGNRNFRCDMCQKVCLFIFWCFFFLSPFLLLSHFFFSTGISKGSKLLLFEMQFRYVFAVYVKTCCSFLLKERKRERERKTERLVYFCVLLTYWHIAITARRVFEFVWKNHNATANFERSKRCVFENNFNCISSITLLWCLFGRKKKKRKKTQNFRNK